MSASRVRASLAAAVALAAVVVPSVAPAAGSPRCGRPRAERRSPAPGFPNDPLFSRQWNLLQINAPEAWAAGATGKGAVIAIVDSGVDVRHPDLGGRMVLPRGVQCAWVLDNLGHGTHVAGVAAASADNGRGIAGLHRRRR